MQPESPYVPVACAFHEGLEFAVLRRQPLYLRWQDGAVERESRVMPTDVRTADGAEWLHFMSESGEAGCVRLDQLLGADPVA